MGVIWTLLSAIFWGVSATCGQYLFEEKEIDAKWLVVVRLLCSGAFLFFIALKTQKNRAFLIFTNKFDTFVLVFYAIFGLFACQYTYYLTIELSNAAIATILQYTSPVFIMIYVAISTKTLPKKLEILALFLVISGVFVLATHLNLNSLNIPKKALIIGLISALCIVVYSITPLKINQKYGILTCLSLGLMISGVIAFFYNKFWNYSGVSDINGYLAVFGVVFFGTILSFSFYMKGLSILGPTKTSLIAALEPVATGFFVYVFLGVRYEVLDYVGFLMIIACTVLLAKK
ncbi:DMT family transporter [Campylobacter portucalensis]|nr:EamA family transporter [Campylobacter portucalensis]